MTPIVADGFDAAIIGLAGDTVVYDADKMHGILEAQGMTNLEAMEYFNFNIAGAYVGENTPIYVTPMTRNEIDEIVDAD